MPPLVDTACLNNLWAVDNKFLRSLYPCLLQNSIFPLLIMLSALYWCMIQDNKLRVAGCRHDCSRPLRVEMVWTLGPLYACRSVLEKGDGPSYVHSTAIVLLDYGVAVVL